MIIVALAILASYLLPGASDQLAGMPSGMISDTPTYFALLTVGLAVIVTVLWYALGRWSWGSRAAVVVGVVGVAFILFGSYSSCLIPHEYCSGMP